MNALYARALEPLDAARAGLLRAASDVPLLPRLLVRRRTRVPILLSLHAVAAFVLALFAPSLLLVAGPLLFGVPHLVSDVRHLVLRRALPRLWQGACLAFAAALFATRALHATWGSGPERLLLEHGIASGWLMIGVLAGAAAGRFRRGFWWAIAVSTGVVAFALEEPHLFRLVLMHGHNLIGIVLWLLLFRRSGRLAFFPVGLVLLGAGLLGSGWLLSVTLRYGMPSLFHLHLFAAADWLAPGVGGAWGIGLAMAFAFLQSIHYGVWLLAIPQDDARSEGSTSFRTSWRRLARDLTPAGASIVVTLFLVVLAAGIAAPVRTQMLVLSLGSFHAWLELTMLAFFVARQGFARPGAIGTAS